MNIKQLKKIIAKLPDHMDVVLRQMENDGDFPVTILEVAKVKMVTFQEDPEGKSGPKCKEKCLMLTDEL